MGGELSQSTIRKEGSGVSLCRVMSEVSEAGRGAAKQAKEVDIIIHRAGPASPRREVISADMVKSMKPGSVVDSRGAGRQPRIDCAESGDREEA